MAFLLRRELLAVAALLRVVAAHGQAASDPAAAPTRIDWAKGGTACQLHPEYPLAAQRAQVTGHSLLHLHVDADDNIVEVHVLRPSGTTREHGLLDAAAVAEVEHCRRFRRAAGTPAQDQWAALDIAWRLDAVDADPHANGWELAQLREAAEHGDANAALAFYMRAPYRPDTAEEAVRWLRFAADKGTPFAQHELGRLYSLGDGVPRDIGQTVDWWERANAGHDTRVTVPLARLLLDPDSPRRDPKRAVELLEQAAASQSGAAMLLLGDIASAGSAGTQDDRAALAWWRRAAREAHLAAACVRLGDAFSAGHGVKPDPVVAASYYLMAKALSDPAANARLAALRVDDATMRQAQEWTQRWWNSGQSKLPE